MTGPDRFLQQALPIASTMAAAPRLQLLRSAQIALPDSTVRVLSRPDAALLALLAVDGPTTRSRATRLLWPDASPEAARNNLRQRLFRLKKLLGDGLSTSGELLSLTEDIRHDLNDPEPSLAQDADSLAGEVLQGHDGDPGQAEFGEWLENARSRWRLARRDALVRLAGRHEEAGRLVDALPFAERLVRDEPLFEEGHRRRLRLHYRNGDRGAATVALGALRECLGTDASLAPETRALIELVRSGANAAPPSMSAMPIGLLRPPRLVGRDDAWRSLERGWAARSLTLVLGEPGIGKTRLLSDFIASKGAVLVAARPGDARVPFALLARLVRRLLQATASVTASGGVDAWALAELAHIVPELGDSTASRSTALRLREATQHLLSLSAASGIALDDLHFGDEATLEMLPHLAHVAEGPRWLLVSRTGEQPAAFRGWLDGLDAPMLVRLNVGPLDRVGVAELLASLALPGFDAEPGTEPEAGHGAGNGTEHGAGRWADRLHRHTGGNPMFILETLLAMRTNDLAATPALPLPDNLRVLIERRLSQLSAEALKLARVAALAGQDFNIELASAVLERHPMDLSDAWRTLEVAQVMRENAFAHDLIFEVTREAMPAPVRQWLHRRIGQVLELQAGAASRLAHHWREAREPARAAASCMQAADAARAIGRLSEESRWLDSAAESFAIAHDSNGRFEAMRRLAASALEALSPTDALQAAEALSEAAVDARQRGIAHKQLGAVHMNGARFEAAAAELDAAMAESTAAGDVDGANHARYLRTLALSQARGVHAAVTELEALLPWAESLADDVLRNEFLADLAILWDQADQRRRARPFFERALSYFERQRQTGNAAAARMMYARGLMMLGELPLACSQLEMAVRERDELSEGEGGQGVEALNLGRIYCELGRYGQALRLLEPSRERLERHALDVVGAATALVLARTHAYLGQTARALTMLKGLPDDLPYHLKAGELWTRALLAGDERPADRRALLAAAVAQFDAVDLPFVRLPMQFDEVASRAIDDASLARCRSMIAECARRELFGAQLLGRMRLVQMLGAAGDTRAASAEASGVVAALDGCMPVGTYLPELYWVCHVAARQGGDAPFARTCLDAAKRWIGDVASRHVPEPFRESFLHRNAINRRIGTAS